MFGKIACSEVWHNSKWFKKFWGSFILYSHNDFRMDLGDIRLKFKNKLKGGVSG